MLATFIQHRGLVSLLTMSALISACSRPTPPTAAVPAVYVSAVRNEAVDAQRILHGSVRARIETDVAFRTGGRVIERLVELGQTVRAGQELARLDPNDLQLSLQAATDQHRAAEIDAVQARSDAQRFRRLLGDGSIGAAEAERQQARADAGDARLKQAGRQLDLARNRLGYATLIAPMDGIVTALRFETGQMVSEGQGVLGLAQPGELDVVVDIPEDLVADLKNWRATAVPGSDAAVSDAKPVVLRLRELAPSANPVSRTSRARFAWPAAAGMPAPHLGMTAQVRLQRQGNEPSADLPLGALLTTPAGTTVWTVDIQTGILTKQPVKLLAQTAARVRVTGLADGTLVVSAGAQKLDAGLKVRPVQRPLAHAPSSEKTQ